MSWCVAGDCSRCAGIDDMRGGLIACTCGCHEGSVAATADAVTAAAEIVRQPAARVARALIEVGAAAVRRAAAGPDATAGMVALARALDASEVGRRG